jgi:hypothetical protein
MEASSPIDLTLVSVLGATFCGLRVTVLTILTEAGTEVTIRLPAPKAGKRPARETELGAAILAALGAAGRPTKQTELARLMGVPPTSGHFKRVCADLVAEGDLGITPGGYWPAGEPVP